MNAHTEAVLRAAAILAVLALAPLLAGAALGPRYGGEIVVGLADLPDSASPRAPVTLTDRLLARLVHETLVRMGPDGTVVPGLAEGIEAGSDREWTLRLPEGAVFHDGRPVDAEAGLRSLQRFLRGPSPAADRLAATLEGGAAYRRRQSEEVPGLVRVDERRLVLRFTAPTAAALAPLTSPAAAITSPADAGAGPFVPTLRGASSIALTPFAAHRRGRPYLDGLSLSLFETPRVLDAEWRTGRVALAPGPPGALVLSSTLLLIFDPILAPFDDPEHVARAAAAIPCADLVARFIPGGQPATLLLPPSLPGGAVAGSGSAASGTESRRPAPPLDQEITMGVEPAVPTLVSQRIVAYLGELGLRVRVRTLPRNMLRMTPVPTHLRLVLWTPEVPEAGLALRELASLAMKVSPEVRGWLEESDREMDPSRRRVLLQRAEAGLRRDLVLPLAWVPSSFRIQPRLHGVRLEATGEPVLEEAWIEP